MTEQSPLPQGAAPEPTFKPYWVLLIDILGFSNRVSDPTQRNRLAADYRELIEKVLLKTGNVESLKHSQPGWVPADDNEPLPEEPPINWAERGAHIDQRWRESIRIFSDSIFMFFGDLGPDSPAAPFRLASTAHETTRELWKRGIPHRGAIAYGDCLVDPHRNIFLGRPVVDVHEWEKAQKWLGVSIAPGSRFSAFANLGGIRSGTFVQNVPIPTSQGEVSTWAINPFPSNLAVDGFLACHADAEKKGDPGVLAKYTNTARFLLERGAKEHLAKRLEQIAGRR